MRVLPVLLMLTVHNNPQCVGYLSVCGTWRVMHKMVLVTVETKPPVPKVEKHTRARTGHVTSHIPTCTTRLLATRQCTVLVSTTSVGTRTPGTQDSLGATAPVFWYGTFTVPRYFSVRIPTFLSSTSRPSSTGPRVLLSFQLSYSLYRLVIETN